MADSRLMRLKANAWLLLIFFMILIVSMYFLHQAAQDSDFFSQWYSLVLGINVLCIIVLLSLIIASFVRLIKRYRIREMGSRLASRLVLIFILLAILPAAFIYYFSLSFLQQGIDSWFDRSVEHALTDALDLSRTALEDRMQVVLNQTHLMAEQLVIKQQPFDSFVLEEVGRDSGATEISLLSQSGHIVATNSVDPSVVMPSQPNDSVFLQLKQNRSYVGLEPLSRVGAGLLIRSVVNVPLRGTPSAFVLQALYPVGERMGFLVQRVEDAFSRYKGLVYLRGPLKSSFILTLSLALLQSVLTAVWLAFYFAQKIVAPISLLAMGTRAVAAGNYEQVLLPQNDDELGSLIQSFNDMTRRVSLARDEARQNQRNAEQQKAYIETVLARLSSGVMTFDHKRTLRTANQAANQILQFDLNHYIGSSLQRLAKKAHHLSAFTDEVQDKMVTRQLEWRGEVTLHKEGRHQLLICSGSKLSPVDGKAGGFVVVFDDITSFVQAQKNSAWGDVARRLAHEIKNPLTPIQLSAERLRHKYLATLSAEDAKLLDKSTRTIVNQVEAMKEMVRAFTDYAQAPKKEFRLFNLNEVVTDVLELYKGSTHVEINVTLANSGVMQGDAGRIRQLLHNLLKNALAAIEQREGEITLGTELLQRGDRPFIQLIIQDNGEGIPDEYLEQIFEPSFTTKTKGTGLGLAIVKKIVEEHQGSIHAENAPTSGARFIVSFPAGYELTAN